jgi:hypothetical protein
LLHFAEVEQVWDALLASSRGFISDPTEQFLLNKSTKFRRTLVDFGPAPCTCLFRLIEMHKRALLLFNDRTMREKSQFGKNPPKCYSFSWFNNATAGGTVKSKCFPKLNKTYHFKTFLSNLFLYNSSLSFREQFDYYMGEAIKQRSPGTDK